MDINYEVCTEVGDEIKGVDSKDDDKKYGDSVKYGSRCTNGYMRTLRRLKWEIRVDWDEEDVTWG